MMESSELRIGNYLFADVGLPSYQAHVLYKGDMIDLLHGKLEGKIFPIPLTEEWLLKFGATQESVSLCFKGVKVGGSVLNINPDNGVAWLTLGVNIINVTQSIEYVHQMQNLYFALTGEELTIKAQP